MARESDGVGSAIEENRTLVNYCLRFDLTDFTALIKCILVCHLRLPGGTRRVQ